MNIGIDIRSLLEDYRTGIGEYTHNLINEFLKKDTCNQYHLFYNQRHSVKVEPPRLEKPNVKYFDYRYPNRFFNLSLRYLGWPRLEKLMGLCGESYAAPPTARGGTSCRRQSDVVWFPNFGFINFNIRVPYVLTVHDLSFERYPEFFTPVHRLWHKMIDCQRMARGAAKVIAVSENTKQDLVELYNIDPSKIEVIYEGITNVPLLVRGGRGGLRPLEDEDNSTAVLNKVKEKYSLPEKFVLFLGTIEPRKNIEVIIKAFDKLCDSSNSSLQAFKLILAGGRGWNNEQIYKVYGQAKHKDKISFLGYVGHDDKPALYQLASLFVFPSIYEGFGLPPLEAMACGTPVIASCAASLPEVVGDAGLLVDPYNINELAEAMRAILEDGKLRQRFIEKGLERVKRFSWHKCAEKMLEILNSTRF